jgi:hypothetical protein
MCRWSPFAAESTPQLCVCNLLRSHFNSQDILDIFQILSIATLCVAAAYLAQVKFAGTAGLSIDKIGPQIAVVSLKNKRHVSPTLLTACLVPNQICSASRCTSVHMLNYVCRPITGAKPHWWYTCMWYGVAQ